MSTLTQFAGGGATTSVVNYYSSGSVQSPSNIAGHSTINAKAVVSGGLTANVLAELLSVTGAGEVPWLCAFTNDTTSRTVRIKVTVDGVSVFDATSSAITTSGIGTVVVGHSPSTNYHTQAPAPLRFNQSLLVEVASSLGETGKVSIAYVLNKR